jgi:hypothetical protein
MQAGFGQQGLEWDVIVLPFLGVSNLGAFFAFFAFFAKKAYFRIVSL